MLMSSASTNEADGIVGKWYTEGNDSVVKIFKATNGKYYGKIVWLETPNEDDGTPKVDDENPDPKLRDKPLIDLMIMKGFTYEGNNEWWNGTIYDPDNGKTYKCVIRLETEDHIFVRGYIGKEWMGLGRTTDWYRAKDK
jgi:uncharacterized protein (DUF2147 family)